MVSIPFSKSGRSNFQILERKLTTGCLNPLFKVGAVKPEMYEYEQGAYDSLNPLFKVGAVKLYDVHTSGVIEGLNPLFKVGAVKLFTFCEKEVI